MFRAFRLRAALAAALLALPSCSHRAQPSPERLLLLPLENQSPDATLDWAAAASPAVFEYDLSTAPRLSTMRADSVASVAGSGADRVLQGYFSAAAGRLSIHATLEDPVAVKTLQTIVREGPVSAGFAPLIDSVAREINPASRAFSTRDPAALEQYGRALLAPDNATKIASLKAAIGHDPKFSTAYQSLAGLLLASGDRVAAAGIAAQGVQTAAAALDKAELSYMAATAQADLPARERALLDIARQSPANLGVLELLGQVHTLERKYRAAIDDYQAVLKLNPRSALACNLTGYLYAYLHDLPNADKSLREYQRLSPPGDPNPIDSMGEVHYLNGDFAKAEQLFREVPGGGELRKAAQARLMTGDRAGADALFAQYLQSIRAGGPGPAALQLAQWEFLSGRKDQAIARLQGLLTLDGGDTASLASSQLAAWRLQAGDRAQAFQLATQARARATSAASLNLSSLCQFLAAPGQQPTPAPYLHGLALVLAGDFAAAIPVLEQLLRESPPASDGEARTLLAWCYRETNRLAAAKPLVDLYPLVFPSADGIFTSLTFPRFLRIRAEVDAADRNTAEAQRLNQLYNEYAGEAKPI